MNTCDVGPLTYYDLALFKKDDVKNQNATGDQALVNTLILNSPPPSPLERVKTTLRIAASKSRVACVLAKQKAIPFAHQLFTRTKRMLLLMWDNSADRIEATYRKIKDGKQPTKKQTK